MCFYCGSQVAAFASNKTFTRKLPEGKKKTLWPKCDLVHDFFFCGGGRGDCLLLNNSMHKILDTNFNKILPALPTQMTGY